MWITSQNLNSAPRAFGGAAVVENCIIWYTSFSTTFHFLAYCALAASNVKYTFRYSVNVIL